MEYEALSPNVKAAILLVSLGKEYCAKIFKRLSEEELEKISFEISNLQKIDSEVKRKVVKEFCEAILAKNYAAEGGISFVKDVLDRALGQQKAYEIINRLNNSVQHKRPFQFIAKLDTKQLLNLIQNEHPQTIALIFSYLEPKRAAEALNALPSEVQSDVIARIANMGRTSPEHINEVEKILEKKLFSFGMSDYTKVGGINTSVAILNFVDRATERHVLETLEAKDAELAQEIKSKMFLFEDIAKLDRSSIQRVLRDVSTSDLTLALKGVSEEFANVIFSNMSTRLQEIIREEMELLGSVRVRDVEEAQQRIVNIVRNLDEAGEIIILRGEEELLVG